MHFASSLAAAIGLIGPLAMAADTTSYDWIYQNNKQKTEYEAYTSHIATLPAFSTATSVIATNTNTNADLSQITVLQAAATATTPVTVPSFATGLPTDVQAFAQSMLVHEVSLLQFDRTASGTATYNAAARPTAVMVAGAAAAAGAVAVGLL